MDAPEGLCPHCLLDQVLKPAGPASGDPTGPASFCPPAPEELAEHFPQLDILELIGHGGMGAVYKARQIALDRLVALKIIRPETSDPTFAERFAREARALAQLNHPNIVTVYDFGRTAGMYYLLMEFVDGVNLRQVLHDDELEPGRALAIVPQICEALEYAHHEGVVHRDIKPENILLDGRGRVKIADFGLAKLVNQSAAEFQLTGTRQVMGTPHYMSPEQMESPQTVDHRADIYSLGVVLYEMLTGELPLGRFEPPSKKVQVDVQIDEIVLRSLERQPDRRYQYVSELKTDVEALGGDVSHAQYVVSGPLQMSDFGGLAVVVAVFALVGVAMFIAQSASPMWGLIVLWWFISGFKWTRLAQTLAGVLGVFLALLTIGVAVASTGSLLPLWALLGVFWFAAEFGWTETEEAEGEDGDDTGEDDDESEGEGAEGEPQLYQGPVLGLSQREKDILDELRRFDVHDDPTFFVLPDIPPGRLANARATCGVPASERILGLIDLTKWRIAKKCLLVCDDTIYFFCGPKAHPDGPVRLQFHQLNKCTIVNGGDRVFLHDDLWIEKGWSGASCEKITNLLLALRELKEPI
jgi:predicted Ser/Thr protein kinase